jgi:hypothetical protein
MRQRLDIDIDAAEVDRSAIACRADRPACTLS